MEAKAQGDLGLNQLQSKAQVELLDAVDQLRLDGFQGELDLPQLIVCGDQSSGKSSVLEAISRVRFPASDGFCTRFASELMLRRSPSESVSVRIEPGRDRNEEQRKHLAQFKPPEEMTRPQDFEMVIQAASKHIRKLDDRSAFFEDKLVAVIRGPLLPPLTLVDLPGLIHASNDEQGHRDIATVKRLVESYMKVPSSIILAVLAANNNFANQEILELAKGVDPRGQRTLGVITKPDQVENKSVSQTACIQYAQNRNIPLDLGWHVLKNRDFNHQNATADERDDLEKAFFSKSPWSELSPDILGVKMLRDKLSRILFRSVSNSMPILISDIKERIIACETNKKRLGEPKSTEVELRSQLITVSGELHKLIMAGVQGNYHDTFFDNEAPNLLSSRRLRARICDALSDFASHMQKEGHSYLIQGEAENLQVLERSVRAEGPQIGENLRPYDKSTRGMISAEYERYMQTSIQFSPAVILKMDAPLPVPVPLSDFLRAITDDMRTNRGCEFDGMCPTGTIARIFRAQSAPWERIALSYTNRCWQIVKTFFEDALRAVAPSYIAHAILENVANDALETASDTLERKVRELLKPYQTGYPITLHNSSIHQAINKGHAKAVDNNGVGTGMVVVRDLAPSTYTTFETVKTYYEIAMNTFLDNVATLAVEHCLIEDLTQIFTPITVSCLDSDAVRTLTHEPYSIVADRETNNKRLQTLKDILKVCNKHVDSLAANPRHPSVQNRQLPITTFRTPSPTNDPLPDTRNTTNPDFTPPLARKASGESSLQPDVAYLTPPRTPGSVVRAQSPRNRAASGSRTRRSLFKNRDSAINAAVDKSDLHTEQTPSTGPDAWNAFHQESTKKVESTFSASSQINPGDESEDL